MYLDVFGTAASKQKGKGAGGNRNSNLYPGTYDSEISSTIEDS